MRSFVRCVIAVSVLVAPSMSSAQTSLYAFLSNDQEVTNTPVVPTYTSGAPRPASFGFALFEINAAQTQMSFTAWIYNIDVTGSQTADVNDNLSAAHMHGPAAPGTNGNVRWGFFGGPLNDNNPPDGVLTPFASGVGGMFTGKWDAPEGFGTTFADQLPNILAGNTYMNFHTVQFPGGEIRGQILVTPEPSTFLLTAAGLGSAAYFVRRRRR